MHRTSQTVRTRRVSIGAGPTIAVDEFASVDRRSSFIVHWPAGIKTKGELRSQPAHVVDLVPTFLVIAAATLASRRDLGITVAFGAMGVHPTALLRENRDDDLQFIV